MKMPSMTVLSLCVAAALGLSSRPAAAEQKVEARRSAAADALVEIDNPAGSISVTGWDRNEVVVTGELGAGASGLDFTGSGSRVHVGVDTERNPHGVISSLEIRVPRKSRLQIESFSGSIAVTDVSGTVSAETVNGSITIGGQAKEISAESVNGSVQIAGASTHTKAESVNGSVTIRGASGDLEASTVNGRLEVSGGSFERAHLETVSGSLSFDGGLASGATLEAETVSGSVTLILPAAVAADFSVSTFSGGVENGFGPPATRVGEYTPEKELEFSTRDGGASVTVHTLSGGITLRKK
jgi:putative adhesin